MTAVREYHDKHGKQILPGHTIRHDNGEEDMVYMASDRIEIGVNASNENHASFDEFEREIYPLHQFNLAEFEIVGTAE